MPLKFQLLTADLGRRELRDDEDDGGRSGSSVALRTSTFSFFDLAAASTGKTAPVDSVESGDERDEDWAVASTGGHCGPAPASAGD